MQREIGITLKEALRLDFWKKAKIVAGMKGIDRVIKSVNIMEVPDIEKWVKEGELLLTTVFAIKDDQEAQQRLIPTLAKRGLAGIAIKPGRYIEEIPTLMLEQADQYAFPLIELPFEPSFSDLVDVILSAILNVQTVILQKSLDTHETLMNVVLKGGGVKEISKNLARLVESPLAILNRNYEVLSLDLLGPICEADLFEINPRNSILQLKKQFQSTEKEVGRFKEHRIQLADGREIMQLSIPIPVGQECYGHIFVWEVQRKLEEIDLISIERAVTVSAMEMLKQESIFEVERRYHNELLYDLLHGRFERDVMLQRAQVMQWNLEGPFAIIILEILEDTNQNRDVRQNHHLRNQLIRGIKNISAQEKDEVIFGEWGTCFVLLYALPTGVENLPDYLSRMFKSIHQLFLGHHLKYHAGVGSVATDLSAFKTSYDEAQEAIGVARATNTLTQVLYYDKLGIFRLLHKVDSAVLQEFLEDILGNLIRYDQENNTELVKTLNCYFENNGNLKQVAKEMYVHYNTILYRIERIEKILTADLAERDARLNLEIALKIYHGWR